jgi:hypothetical protein
MEISRANPFVTFGTPVLIHPQIFKQPEAGESEPPLPTLAGIPPEQSGVPYPTWRAARLNELFRQHGTAGPGHITAATVEDGLLKQCREKRTLE